MKAQREFRPNKKSAEERKRERALREKLQREKPSLSDLVAAGECDPQSIMTMGMYFDFLLGPERFKDATPVLLEFDGSKWVEFKTYDVDIAAGRISMHCPNGGTFVVAAKP